ncbi:hypothetical protein ABIB87_009032 [Bradyrhizobium sp. JR18.2]
MEQYCYPWFLVEGQSVRLRWIMLAGSIGALIAWRYENFVALYVTAFGCLILLGLRRIGTKLDEHRAGKSGHGW